MSKTNCLVKKINNYQKWMKILDCAYYVYLDEIKKFEFKKVSKYNKSRTIYERIEYDFNVINEFIGKQDLLNAATILRTLYENIIYIIAKSYNKEINITMNTPVKTLREVLENNCQKIFTNYFKKEDFNEIYTYLCKIVHPCSMKELLSYMGKTTKYKNYLLNNLKYIMLLIQYLYLNFLNKRVGNEESKLDLYFIDLCSYVNLVNVNYFVNDVKNMQSFIKRFFYYDQNTKYVNKKQEVVKEIHKSLTDNEKIVEIVEKNIEELGKSLEKELKESGYNEAINEILNRN